MLRILYGLNAGLGGAAVGRGFRSVAGLRTTGGGDALDVVQTRIGHLFVQILKMQTKLWISEKKDKQDMQIVVNLSIGRGSLPERIVGRSFPRPRG